MQDTARVPPVSDLLDGLEELVRCSPRTPVTHCSIVNDRAWLAVWEQGRKVLGKPALSREERRERLLALTERFRQEAAQFFEEHPDFYPQEGNDGQPRQRAPTPGAYAGAGG
jgi:hypothetical protein